MLLYMSSLFHSPLVVDEEDIEEDDEDEDSEIHTVVYFWQVPAVIVCLVCTMSCYHGYCVGTGCQ